MLDSIRGGNDNGTHDDNVISYSKTQYTVKGIQKTTVEAVREAARKEGMKINSWVSVRLREAADRSLHDTASIMPDIGELSKAVDDVRMSIEQYKMSVASIQQELHEITKFQRTLMTVLMERK